MLRRFGGSSNSLWRPKNPHSLDYLKYLHTVLVKNEKVVETNRKILVEALRAIAEILIWGDQNDSSVFDFFLERQMLSYFLQIMKQDGGSLNVQLLQTLNILFENIRHETSLYFLLSNNHVNSIITHTFDFTNEEIMAYYISFLKTLSFKLNPSTIHFFFNEATEEFPLLTESLKFFDSTESMVRIAVRNIVLNIVRVNDPSMTAFVKGATKVYLYNLVDSLVTQAIELDTFVRSAENVIANRDRLREKVDDLVDLLHYMGELLEVDAIADSLSMLICSRFLVPLLLNSLAPRRHNNAILLTPVSSLFFFAQFLLVISHRQTIQTFLSAFLFEDASILATHWVRDGNMHSLQPVARPPRTDTRVFFEALLCAFDSSKNDDYLSFYGLMLIYAMFQNKGDVGELLAAANLPSLYPMLNQQSTDSSHSKSGPLINNCRPITSIQLSSVESPSPPMSCDERIIDALLSIVDAAGKEDSRLRPITLELACLVLRQILLVVDHDQMHSSIGSKASHVLTCFVDRLGLYVNSENLFLEWFEDEYAEFEVNHIKLETIGYEMLLPPCNTAMSGLALHKRLPSGFEERIRTIIQFYFHIRKLSKDMSGEAETELPLHVGNNSAVEVGDCINLSGFGDPRELYMDNSDLLSCVVVLNKNERLSRFLVTDRLQLILVEPDTRKAGWAIVRFVGLLQDTQISGDPTDSKSLHVVVEGQPSRQRKRQALLTARFVFDDHIRCMAAKQRLTKGRQTARGLKLQAICDLLGVPRLGTSSPRSNPFRIVKGCAPGSVRKFGFPMMSARSSSNSVPDDPAPRPSSASSSMSGVKHV
ncbi:FPL domain-containing protein [Trichostrongylus colubriformis]|uniref:FPL domain-containing protein n=1 Tax=Trichostrongylus colubriformis TaxID=6319 RepID=A0AAN8FGP4_TRICO